MSSSCPEGMYPMDCTNEPEEFGTFAELKADAERASDSLNFPIGWTLYDEADEDWGLYVEDGETDQRRFTLVFLMPRKWGQTWGMTTQVFDRAEVQTWLDTWLRGEVNRWYGWETPPPPERAVPLPDPGVPSP